MCCVCVFIFLFFADRIVGSIKKKKGCHTARNTCLSPSRRKHPRRLPTCRLQRFSSCTACDNKYGHAINKMTLDCKEQFTPHQFAKSDNKHHCTGTLTWNGHNLRTASSPQEDCIIPVYLIKSLFKTQENILVQIFVLLYKFV